jgi:hypothetical protein
MLPICTYDGICKVIDRIQILSAYDTMMDGLPGTYLSFCDSCVELQETELV